MEILIEKLLSIQDDLEDALRIESTFEEVKETKEGKKLLRYLRRRRYITNCLAETLDNI